MRIGYVLNNFPPLSETFIRRDVLQLCQLGHLVFIYTHHRHRDPLVPEPEEPRLKVREVLFQHRQWDLVEAARSDGIEHLHSSLMLAAHHATHRAANVLQIPFTLTAYSGHDIFTATDPNLFRDISRDPLCAAIIAEDPFMRDWLAERLGADKAKIRVIANSLDLELYRLSNPRSSGDKVVILSIARFVEKKGLLDLIRAFKILYTRHTNVELWLVGRGPLEPHLRTEAGNHPQIKFLGAVSEDQTRPLYEEADIFCLPCIKALQGDADGVPTTILEAMAFELPIVTSDLLSAPYYVRNKKEGLLTPPGDVEAIASALETLWADPGMRRNFGRAGRVQVSRLCNIKKNCKKLENLIITERHCQWQNKLNLLLEHRKTYTLQTIERYNANYKCAIEYFNPHGLLLDIGCGSGDIRIYLPPHVTYYGCDPISLPQGSAEFNFSLARGEKLPFKLETFDSVLLYSMLSYAIDVDAVLDEALRVLKPGGEIYLYECINDPNPLHLNHLTDVGLKSRIAGRFNILASRQEGRGYLLMKARKPADIHIRPKGSQSSQPLVNIAITTFNRSRYIRECIDSAIAQTYQNLEVIVVDDGSTDGTPGILRKYGNAIRFTRNTRNQGIAYSKNRALKMTSEKARYVAILDSDDFLHPDFVKKCVNFLETHPGIGLVYTDDFLVNDRGQVLEYEKTVSPWNIDVWLRTRKLHGDGWMAYRDLVMKTDLHDLSITHDVDYDLYYQLLVFTTFAHLPEALLYYRHHADQSARRSFKLAMCHAANLVKYGYSPEYAYLRARYNPEWIPSIEKGIALGKKLRQKRKEKKMR